MGLGPVAIDNYLIAGAISIHLRVGKARASRQPDDATGLEHA